MDSWRKSGSSRRLSTSAEEVVYVQTDKGSSAIYSPLTGKDQGESLTYQNTQTPETQTAAQAYRNMRLIHSRGARSSRQVDHQNPTKKSKTQGRDHRNASAMIPSEGGKTRRGSEGRWVEGKTRITRETSNRTPLILIAPSPRLGAIPSRKSKNGGGLIGHS